MHQSPETFARILAEHNPLSPNAHPLQNLTFFTGAGFAKSWDMAFPTGDELFTFTFAQWSQHGELLDQFLSLNNYFTHGLNLSASMFKDIVYQIGMMRKYPAIRPRYIDDQNLDAVERHLRYLVRKKFEQTAPLYFEQDQKLSFDGPLAAHQEDIMRFFRLEARTSDGSSGVPSGLRWNFVSTNYDYVIEAIRDNCLGPEDTYALYAYRGVTPTRYSNRPPYSTVFDNWLVSNVLKINGGFEVFKNGAGFDFDYTNDRSDAELRAEPPQLMLASREQDYTQQYFHAMFPKVVRLLHESSIMVLVGYSLPEEDALLRLIIKQFAEDRADGISKVVYYIDLASEAGQLQKVQSVFPHADESHGLTVVPYSGSFSSWCADVVQKYVQLTR